MSTIRAQSARRAAPLLLATLWLGCGQDEPTAPKSMSQSLESIRSITGRLFGPDGRSICRTVPEDVTLVELLNPDYNGLNEPFLDSHETVCPDNSFAVGVNAATAHLRATLPLSQDLGRLPWRTLDEFHVPLSGVNHPLRIAEGTALGGRATFNGQPIEGVPFTIAYDFNPGFGATFGSSGPDGRWTEFFGRTPPRLEADNRYFFFGCFMLGATLPEGIPSNSFVFPSDRQNVSCRLQTAPAARFSHTATRLVVTPMPGDIGGAFSGELFDQFGVGWGAQFPVPPGSTPERFDNFASHIFAGGLIIGLPAQGGHPARVFHGVDGTGTFACGNPCRDLGLDGVVSFTPTGASGERKQVTWRYSDAGSSDPVGLQILQRSVEGIRPHDYVLFRFRIRNASSSTLTLYAGFFGDLDVEFDSADDLGATALEGRLMYQVSAAESGIHFGTLLLGDAPVSGNFFFGIQQDPVSIAGQIQALRGERRRSTAGPTDLRYIHGAGPITLDPHEAQDVWLAVLAGESRKELLDNAAAARAHVAKLRNLPLTDAGETSRMAVTGARRTATRPTCKSCKPK